ncbi:MAG: caspase family protein [Mesorhizobium sp.]|nr:caspase family protein [Mesorhizobium sp.]
MRRTSGKALIAAAALAAGIGLGATDGWSRTNRALVVGVTEYPKLPKSDWLEGPKNDAILVRDFLVANGAAPFAMENITLLASGVEGAIVPTRYAILAALGDLAARAEQGDFIYIQFSGHGSQQPALDPRTEIDGKDEIFLAQDTGPMDPATKRLSNVITDDEIGAALDAIRNRGAFVWVVFDACHSGTATRAAGFGNGEVDRKISPESLGFTPEILAEAAGEATHGGDDRENSLGLTDDDADAAGDKGGMVAFFAAQTVETTPELYLPEEAPDARKYGLFTYSIFSKLAENPNATYRQLSQGILQHYSGLNRTKPTPLFEGDLDAPVFGSEPGDAVMQWKIAVKDGVVTLPAGLLHRVAPGTKLAILPSPLSETSEAVGYLDVRSSGNLTSQLLPAAYGGRAAVRVDQIPEGAFARVAELEMNFELIVARPPASPGMEAEMAMVDAALDALAADKSVPLKLKIVAPEERADIRFAVMREADVAGAPADAPTEPVLWLLPASGEITLEPGKRPPAIAIRTDDAARLRAALGDNLVLISRAINLSRLAGASDFRSRDVSVSFLIQREGSAEFEPIEAGAVPFLHPGDSIYVKASNNSRRPVDLNIIYIGSDYMITSAAEPIRLHERDELEETGLFTVNKGSFGREQLMAVLTEAAPQTPTLDLGYLAQRGVREMTRGAGAPDGFAGLLSDIAKAPATRDVKRFEDKRGSKGAVMIFPVETAPRAE